MKLSKCDSHLCGLAAALLLGAISTPTYAGAIKHSFESTTQSTGSDAYLSIFNLSGRHGAKRDDNNGSRQHDGPKHELPTAFGSEHAFEHGWIFGEGQHGDFHARDFDDFSWKKNLGRHHEGSDCPPVTEVPVPAAAWLMFSGLVGLGGFRSRYLRAQA